MELLIGRKGSCSITLLGRWQETTDRKYVGKWDLKVETEALIIIFTVNLGLSNDLEWNKFTLHGLYYGVGQNGVKPKLTVMVLYRKISEQSLLDINRFIPPKDASRGESAHFVY